MLSLPKLKSKTLVGRVTYPTLPFSIMSQPTILHRDTTDPQVFQSAVWGRVFNARRDTSRIPLAVVKARTTADIVSAVQLAQKENCRVSVRSGGHSWAGWSVRSDAVLVDLGDLDFVDDGKDKPEWAVDGGRGGGRGRIEYDEKSKVVSCPASTTGRMLNGYLKAKGRMFAGGHCPDVGLGGFLLQGGMGWNCKVCSLRSGVGDESAVANI
jgi:FAD/FMN-containing dehydrogenase